MSAEPAKSEAAEQRIDDLAVQVDLLQAMIATMYAIMLRTASEGQYRNILQDLRRSILVTIAGINPGADEQTRLSHEKRTDRVIDEIARLSRQ